jgi:DNA binding domain, excisionase family
MKKIKLFVLAKGFAMLTTKEAAELLDITPRRVQELIKNGALEARKASGVWLIDKDSVNARLRSVTKTGDAPVEAMEKARLRLPS